MFSFATVDTVSPYHGVFKTNEKDEYFAFESKINQKLRDLDDLSYEVKKNELRKIRREIVKKIGEEIDMTSAICVHEEKYVMLFQKVINIYSMHILKNKKIVKRSTTSDVDYFRYLLP